jgi:hypothetical protein
MKKKREYELLLNELLDQEGEYLQAQWIYT